MSEEDMVLTQAEREQIVDRVLAALHHALDARKPRDAALYLDNAQDALRRVTRRVWERALD